MCAPQGGVNRKQNQLGVFLNTNIQTVDFTIQKLTFISKIKYLSFHIAISSVHHFFPTLLLTLIQGFLLMGAFLVGGVILATMGLAARQHQDDATTMNTP